MADESVLNTIDRAIEDCKEKIQTNKSNSRIILLLIALVLITFVGILMNSGKIQEEKLKTDTESIDKLLIVSSQFTEDVNNAKDAFDKISVMAYSEDDGRSVRKASRDSITSLNVRFKKTLKKFETIKGNIGSSGAASSVEFILYGIFILVFGVLTSFYRYFLKEISKYEHFLFGMHRIRIAANNYQGGFADEVRTALTNNAFSNGSDKTENIFSRKSKIESPIPGHPSSDAATFLLNKILQSIEVNIKPKPPGSDKNESSS